MSFYEYLVEETKASDKLKETARLHFIDGLSAAEACRKTQFDEANFRRARRNHKDRYNNWLAENQAITDGGAVASTLIKGKEGDDFALKWIKQKPDEQALRERLKSFLDGLQSKIPKTPKIKSPKKPPANDLCNLFIITDYHLGMMASATETGADWDMEIAERTIIDWFRVAIETSPRADTAIFAQLGDFIHTDSPVPKTPGHGHILDASARFYEMNRTAIRIYRAVVKMLLETHNSVHLVVCDANHDPTPSIIHREWLDVFYDDEPRVSVDISPKSYNAYQWGDQAIFFTHGHKKKFDALPTVFASEFREMYGATKFAEAHCGHFHHEKSIESNLMMVFQHRTLAAPDAYAASGGYFSERDSRVFTYHKKYGRVGQNVINIRMVEDYGSL